MIWKGDGQDAVLFALKDWPALGMATGDKKNLGRFRPDQIGRYHRLLARGWAEHWVSGRTLASGPRFLSQPPPQTGVCLMISRLVGRISEVHPGCERPKPTEGANDFKSRGNGSLHH